MVSDSRRFEEGPFRHTARSAALIAALLVLPGLALAEGVVRQVAGQVELGRGEPPVWSKLEQGAAVAPSDRIRTGANGRVELALDAGTLRVHENSLLRLPAASAETDTVELDAGHSLFDVVHRTGRRFEVKTPLVVVSVKGTRFGVEAEHDAGVVSVFRGVVGLHEAGEHAAAQAAETLIRAGFLAAGGAGRPFELEVLPVGDPWAAWQDFEHDHGPRPAAVPPVTELDRAKASVRQATDAEVIKRAADRRPEIAERLRQHVANSNRGGDGKHDARGSTDDGRSVPASPDVTGSTDEQTKSEDRDALGRDAVQSVLDGRDRPSLDRDGSSPTDTTRDSNDNLRSIVDSQRAKTSMEAVQTVVDIPSLTGGAPLANGGTTLSTDDLTRFDPRDVSLLMTALQDMQSNSTALAQPMTQSDMINFLRTDLQSKGMDSTTADRLVQSLFK